MSAVSLASEPKLAATLHTDYFTVRFDPSDQFLAKLMAGVANDELRRISRELGYVPEKGDVFPLNIYSSHYAFIEAGGLQDSKFTVGTARSTDQSISIDASGAFVSTQEVLAHEITHAVTFRILRGSEYALPLWMNEGLAKYESGSEEESDSTAIAGAAAESSLIPLNELKDAFPKNQEALAYAESESAIKYLIEIAGHQAPRVYLAELARTGSSDSAFMKAAHESQRRFESDWWAKTNGGFRWLKMSTIVGSLISVIMALLAVAAYLVRRKQKIQAAKRWEWEEFEESMRRQLGNDWHR